MAANKQISHLNQVTSDFSHVYFIDCTSLVNNEINSSNIVEKVQSPDFEFPVVADSITYNLGDTSSEYVKLASGENWACKRTKDDPDISFNVASNNSKVAELFATAKTNSIGVTPPVAGATTKRVIGYDAATVKVVYGALVFADDAGNIEILPKCELSASRGKDSVAYWAVKVNPLQNSEGVSVFTVVENDANVNVTQVFYLASSKSSGVTIAEKGWQTTPPELTSTNKYLWCYTQVGANKSAATIIHTLS